MSTSTLNSRTNPTSPSVIAAYNKRRLHGDYGPMPNNPTTGVSQASGASSSAIKAYNTNCQPKLWYPEASADAHKASNLASLASSASLSAARSKTMSSMSPVEIASLASKAANSAVSVTGEEYVERSYPEYQQSKESLSIAQMGAQRSQTMAREEAIEFQRRAVAKQEAESGLPMDISKVLSVAQKNADARVLAARNHLPSNFGISTEEEKAERRQQVLSLITIADRNVKAKLSELNKDSQSHAQLFGSLEFQKIAMDIAARSLPDRLENHGKVNLGGGLYMSSDDIDDIARRHVQPVLEKVQQVADKKRIADREAAERLALQRKSKDQLKVSEKERKAEEKRISQAEKAIRKQTNSWMKQKNQWENRKEQHPEGSRLWLLQRVDHLKEEVKEAKRMRDDKVDYAANMQRLADSTKAEAESAAREHHSLKEDYFNRGDVIDAKKAEIGDDEDIETVSLFELTQQRQTVKENVMLAKQKREDLETLSERYAEQAEQARVEADEAKKQYHDLKVEYFDVNGKAEEAQKQFEKDEAERLERERQEAEAAAAAEREERARAAEADRVAAIPAATATTADTTSAAATAPVAASTEATETPASGAAPASNDATTTAATSNEAEQPEHNTAATPAPVVNKDTTNAKSESSPQNMATGAGIAAAALSRKKSEKNPIKSLFSKFKRNNEAEKASGSEKASDASASASATKKNVSTNAAPTATNEASTTDANRDSANIDNYEEFEDPAYDPSADNDFGPLRLPEASPAKLANDYNLDENEKLPSAVANETQAMVNAIKFKESPEPETQHNDKQFNNFDSSNVRESISMFKEDF